MTVNQYAAADLLRRLRAECADPDAFIAALINFADTDLTEPFNVTARLNALRNRMAKLESRIARLEAQG